MGLGYTARRALWTLGYDITRFSLEDSTVLKKRKLFEHHRIDGVLDIGANDGLFAQHIRHDVGFAGLIVSFEPLAQAYEGLKARAAADALWRPVRLALGNEEAEMPINVSANSYSSSLLDMLPAHAQAAPESAYVTSEMIQVKRLDDVLAEVREDASRLYMKVDTQGFEKHVLEGAQRAMASIHLLQLELSLVPLYQGESLFGEMLAYVQSLGYALVGLEPGFTDPKTGHLLQIDGVFARRPA